MLELINKSIALQAIVWGIIAVFGIKYLPALLREFSNLLDKSDEIK